MALTERIRAALHVLTAPGAAKSSGSQQAWNTIFTTGMDRFFSATKMTQPYAQHPTVHAAISAIATSISALPLEMFTDSPTENEDSEKRITNSIVGDLLGNPGPDMDGPQLIEGTVIYMKLHGEAFWFLDGLARRDPRGPQFPTSITMWDPACVKAISKNGALIAWEYQDGSQGDVFRTAPENVVQFKHFNPYDPIRGLSPLGAAKLAATGGYKALLYQDSFFDNNAVPYGILTPKGDQIVQPEAMLRLRDELEGRQMGAGKHGRIGALNSQIEFQELGMSHKDMDFPVWLDAASAFILMVFKVPPSVAGIQKDANYNESIHQSKRFWYNHLPLVHYLERRIEKRLCEQFGIPEEPYFQTEMILPLIEDQESMARRARDLWNMGVPFTEINRRLKMGFDLTNHLSADTPWVPFSMVNADDQAQAIPAREQVTGQPTPGQQNKPGDMPTQDQPTAGKGMNLDPREWTRSLSWRTLISKVRVEEEAYARAVRQHLYLLRNEVLTKLRGRKGLKLAGDINVESIMFDEDRAAKDIEKKVEPIYKSSIEKGVETVIAELRLDIDFSLLSPAVAKFLHEKMFEIADLVDGPVADMLRTQLEEGIRLGESVDKIADRVTEAFDTQRFRAYRIARTEVAESFNSGRYGTMKDAGVEKLEWLSARDDRVRDSHQEVDGEVIMLGDHFSNGLLYPLDPSGPPEEIVNCRCVSVPVA
jgi:HK97 family phage portal protein